MQIRVLSALTLLVHTITLSATEIPPAQYPQQVGGLGETREMHFDGNRVIPDDSLRKALRRSSSFVRVSHPKSRLEPFLEEVRSGLVRGYHAAGFPDPVVTPILMESEEGPVLQVHITEGPRFKKGDLDIRGGTKAVQDELRARLLLGKTYSQDSKGNVEADEIRTQWIPGEFVSFTNREMEKLKHEISEVYAHMGYFFPIVHLEILREKEGETAVLRIQLEETGPACVVGEVSVEGLSGDIEEKQRAVEAILQLEPGEPLNARILKEAEQRLKRSTAFSDASITYQQVSPDSRAVNLTVEISEFRKAPPLGTPLTPEQEVFVRFCEWLEQWKEGGEPLVISVETPEKKESASIVFSPKEGVVGSLSYTTDPSSEEQTKGGKGAFHLVLDRDQTGLFHQGAELHYQLPPFPHLTFHITCAPISDPKPEAGSMQFLFGAAFETQRHKAPISWKINMSPAMVHLFDPEELHLKGDVLHAVLKEETYSLKLRIRKDGMLLGFLWEPLKGEGMRIEITTQADGYEKAKRTFESKIAGSANAYDRSRPVSSVLSLLSGGIDQSADYLSTASVKFGGVRKPAASSDQIRNLSLVLNVFAENGLFYPLDQAMLSTQRDVRRSQEFSIPAKEGEPIVDNVMIFAFSSVFHSLTSHLLPEGSWPEEMALETIHASVGNRKYLGNLFARLQHDERVGPVGYLLLSHLMPYIKPDAKPLYASRGLEVLAAEDFQKDWRLLLPKNDDHREQFAQFLLSLGKRTDEEMAALAGFLGMKDAAAMNQMLQELGTQPGTSLEDMLEPLLDGYWTASGRANVQRALKAAYLGDREESMVIAATVNGVPIERASLLMNLQAKAAKIQQASGPDMNAVANKILGEFIIRELLYQDFEKRLGEELPALMDQIIETHVRNRLQGEAGRLPQEAREAGLSLGDLKKGLLMEHYLRELLMQVPVPDEEQKREFYHQHKSQFVRHPETATLHAIILPVVPPKPPKMSEDPLTYANALYQEIMDGRDFADLARRHSRGPGAAEGGILGEVTLRQLPPQLRKLALTLELDTVSQPVHVGNTAVLLKVVERKDPVPLAYEEVKGSLQAMMLQAAGRTAANQKLEALKAEAEIKFYALPPASVTP